MRSTSRSARAGDGASPASTSAHAAASRRTASSSTCGGWVYGIRNRSSPELAEFSNLRAPTAPVQPPLGKNLLWRLLSHLFLNYLSVADAENLRSVLKLYIFTETRDRNSVLSNTQRVEAIREVAVKDSDRFVEGRLLRGQEITVRIDPQGFTGEGDLYLFGSVLDLFLGNYAAVNAFTRLTVEDTSGKERMTWPIRLGDRILL